MRLGRYYASSTITLRINIDIKPMAHVCLLVYSLLAVCSTYHVACACICRQDEHVVYSRT